MGNVIDMSGQKIGLLTVVRLDYDKQREVEQRTGRRRTFWFCLCDCGNTTSIDATQLRIRPNKSCGCINAKLTAQHNKTHGMSGTKEHKTWKGIHERCRNKKLKCYGNYGGRGIKVCDRWDSFENFYADMGDAPTPSHSIERIDVNGNYEPSNCKWATPIEQANNKNQNKYIEHDGLRLTYSQWGRKIGLKPHTIRARIEAGYSPKDALNPELVDKTSVARGVIVCKATGRYRASISVDNKTIQLGRFANKEDAIKARIDAEIKYRGRPDSDRVSAVYTAHQ